MASADDIQSAVRGEGGMATVSNATREGEWIEIRLHTKDQQQLCMIERNAAGHSEIVGEEVEDFLDELDEAKPETAASWLSNYMKSVRTIYAFQVFDAAWQGDNWGVLAAAYDTVFRSVRSVAQADGEGFSNEQGFHILWQFPDDVKGERLMAVLRDGQWVKFRMDLANRAQRAAFLKGDVPPGVALIP